MKRTYLLLFFVLLVFSSCKHELFESDTMSPEAIVSHMNSNFDGTFMLLSSKKIDEPRHKGTEVFMSCTRFPGKTIYTEQIWSHENTF